MAPARDTAEAVVRPSSPLREIASRAEVQPHQGDDTRRGDHRRDSHRDQLCTRLFSVNAHLLHQLVMKDTFATVPTRF